MVLDHGDQDIARSTKNLQFLWRKVFAVNPSIKVHVQHMVWRGHHESRFRREPRLN